MEQIVEQMKLIYKMMASDDFAEAVADMLWNIYTKAKAKGFSDQQAMDLALSFAQSMTNK
jgi:hypothetical protein